MSDRKILKPAKIGNVTSEVAKNAVSKISTIDRPCTVSLISAIEDVIDNVAVGNMTPVEVYGCLHMVAAKYLNAED